jgi:hypothetical protein
VRCEISARSFSAKAAYRCSMNGSVSAPSSDTMNGTLCAISPEMKCTSRDSRSSLDTMTGPPAFFAALIAAASFGRRASASAPLPLSCSVNRSASLKPSALAKRLDGVRLRGPAVAALGLTLGAQETPDVLHVDVAQFGRLLRLPMPPVPAGLPHQFRRFDRRVRRVRRSRTGRRTIRTPI